MDAGPAQAANFNRLKFWEIPATGLGQSPPWAAFINRIARSTSTG